MIELSEHLRMQVKIAAQGCISGTLGEWPHLRHALKLLGHDMPKDTICNPTVRELCKKLAAMSLLLLLSSCVVYEHTATSKNGNTEHDKIASFGGTTSQRGADGSSLVHDHQQSARDFFSTVGTVAGTIGYGYVQHAKNASDALTVQQLNKQQSAEALAKIKADEAIQLSKQTPTITKPPQQVAYPP